MKIKHKFWFGVGLGMLLPPFTVIGIIFILYGLGLLDDKD